MNGEKEKKKLHNSSHIKLIRRPLKNEINVQNQRVDKSQKLVALHD
jgi:hypothetical protein